MLITKDPKKQEYYDNLRDLSWFFWQAFQQSPNPNIGNYSFKTIVTRRVIEQPFSPDEEIKYPKFLAHQLSELRSYAVLTDLIDTVAEQIFNQVQQFVYALGGAAADLQSRIRTTSENHPYYAELVDTELQERFELLKNQIGKYSTTDTANFQNPARLIQAGYNTGILISSQLIALGSSQKHSNINLTHRAANIDLINMPELEKLIGIKPRNHLGVRKEPKICDPTASYQTVKNKHEIHKKIATLQKSSTIGCPALYKPSKEMVEYARSKFYVGEVKSLIKEVYQALEIEFSATRIWYNQLPDKSKQRIYTPHRRALEGEFLSRCPMHAQN